TEATPVFVEAPARLHLGLIDLRGDLGRRFGGMGAALAAPSMLLEARPAAELSATGPEADRLLLYARRFFEHHGVAGGAQLRLHRAIPAHAGLGSGTQLALATAGALATIFGRPTEATALAEATRRGERSAIGTWAFAKGGFIVEGGRRIGGTEPAPVLMRYDMPGEWRCLLVVPDVARGLSGAEEDEAFRKLPPPPTELAERIAHRILMLVLPALAEKDIVAFGRGVTEVQQLVGETFRPVQGARFAHRVVGEVVDELLASGAAGAGQSSWGPAAFGLFGTEEDAARAAERMNGRGDVFLTPFNNTGSRIWRGEIEGP
ncbi:MAG: beta-ribofuranosylaminobenzene 5'-phosphate synthase family protein, partial [Vicinamibacteria bacterium]